jgi:hypothetical protein
MPPNQSKMHGELHLDNDHVVHVESLLSADLASLATQIDLPPKLAAGLSASIAQIEEFYRKKALGLE